MSAASDGGDAANAELAWGDAALPFLAWSHIFSSMVQPELRAAAWEALELPDSFEIHGDDYWNTFQTGVPAPPVSLLLHGALGRPGQSVREDWLRVMEHLGLSWNNMHLPPDQLGAACEVYACAVQAEEQLVVDELRARYLLPWCEAAEARLLAMESPLVFMPRLFSEDLRGV